MTGIKIRVRGVRAPSRAHARDGGVQLRLHPATRTNALTLPLKLCRQFIGPASEIDHIVYMVTASLTSDSGQHRTEFGQDDGGWFRVGGIGHGAMVGQGAGSSEVKSGWNFLAWLPGGFQSKRG